MDISGGQAAIIIAVLTHGISTIWWMATMSANLRTIREEITRLSEELGKRDNQIEAIWKKIDELKERVLTIK